MIDTLIHKVASIISIDTLFILIQKIALMIGITDQGALDTLKATSYLLMGLLAFSCVLIFFSRLKRFSRRRYLVLLTIALTFCLANFARSAFDAFEIGGIDLRPKILGARALEAGLDPYLAQTFAWSENTPTEFRDPHVRHYPGLSRVTYPPSLLLFYMPLDKMPYKLQRLFWWVAEWAALAGTITILANSIQDDQTRRAFVGIAAFAFGASWLWRFHVAQGQYYIFVAFLISMELWALRSSRHKWLGISAGIAAALRPTAIILLPLLWLMGERRGALRGLVATLMIITATLPFAGLPVWQSYKENVSLFADKVAHGLVPSPAPGPTNISAFIEGYDLGGGLQLRGKNLTICGIPNVPSCFELSKLLYLVVVLGGCALLIVSRTFLELDLRLLVLTGTVVLTDYAVPMRWDYADVIFLPLLSVLVPLAGDRTSSLGNVFLSAAIAACILPEGDVISVVRQLCFIGAMLSFAVALISRASASSSLKPSLNSGRG